MYWATGILGLFMIIAPYLFGFAGNATALWTSVLSGLIVGIVSVIEGMRRGTQRWEYWVTAIIGVFAIIAPFIFGFTSGAMWSTLILGLLIAVMAGSTLWTGPTHKA